VTSSHPVLSPPEFVAKWRPNVGSGHASAQEYFIDICRMVGAQTPNEADPTRERYTFEREAEKMGGGDGFADVWMRDHFGWENKGKHKDLDAAYAQLQQYREALGNPPLLVVADFERIVVHTNFNNTEKQAHVITLDDLLQALAEPLRILRALFFEPNAITPQQTPDAGHGGGPRDSRASRSRCRAGYEPEQVARTS
jgi:hypothetical protein